MGVCIQGGLQGGPNNVVAATAVVSMHPGGMHSCYQYNYSLQVELSVLQDFKIRNYQVKFISERSSGGCK